MKFTFNNKRLFSQASIGSFNEYLIGSVKLTSFNILLPNAETSKIIIILYTILTFIIVSNNSILISQLLN